MMVSRISKIISGGNARAAIGNHVISNKIFGSSFQSLIFCDKIIVEVDELSKYEFMTSKNIVPLRAESGIS